MCDEFVDFSWIILQHVLFELCSGLAKKVFPEIVVSETLAIFDELSVKREDLCSAGGHLELLLW